ncbi:MAG TPA: 3-dehydroquinate synthase [Deltaproteobacteria bacterium]|nr:3-dehydroquinate synthase [Deltaproteobacteria bacterium]
MRTLTIELPGRSYDIRIGTEVLDADLPDAVARSGTTHAVVVTNTTIHDLYPDRIAQALKGWGGRVDTWVLPDGEEYKNLEMLNRIFDFLMDVRANRKTLLIAFGGGVIGDMVGFASATFMRGIPFLQVPTTLLADVDSSVGGKTAVNHPRGKNTIGAFKQPIHVCMDLAFLRTLPPREFLAGYFELVKHGFIHDVELFEMIQAGPIVSGEYDYRTNESEFREFWESAVLRSCEVKGKVVEQDETEAGIRATLNFGHTLGHLIETHAGYGTYLHGEAVGTGMLFAAYLSRKWGHLSEGDWSRIRDFLVPRLIPVVLPALEADAFRTLILHDKKAGATGVDFILLRKLGEGFIRKATPVATLWPMFQEFVSAFPEVCRVEQESNGVVASER